MKVAFQGSHGAYSEEALYSHFGDNTEALGFELSEQVCEALEQGEVDLAILPVENSIVGNVTINLDLLYQGNFFVLAEVYHPITHCLLALPGVELEDIEVVRSHPIALAQCRDFINRHNYRALAEFDTAGAAKLLAKKQLKNEATISSSLSASKYGLNVLSNQIQKVTNNMTRFLVFKNSDKDINRTGDKTSLAFVTNHKPGALLNCLKEFSRFDINLTKLESRPIPENPFEYVFFVDFLGGLNDLSTTQCLKALEKDTKSIKVLGSYPIGKKPL